MRSKEKRRLARREQKRERDKLIAGLRAEGRSVAAIAAAAGCTENTVRAVLFGARRPGPHPAPGEWDEGLGVPLPPVRASLAPACDGESPRRQLAAPVRCRGCGARQTQLPCVACAASAETARGEMARMR